LRNRSTPFAEVDMYKILVQRPGPENLFFAVIEAFKGHSSISRVRQLTALNDVGKVRAVEVTCADTTDITIIADQKAATAITKLTEYPALTFTGRIGFISLQAGAVKQMWMMGGEKLTYGTLALSSVPRYEGKILSLDRENYAVTVDCDIPPGKSWAGEQMLVAGRTDGAYVIEEIQAVGDKRLIKPANEPIFTLQVGDTFTIVPAAGLEVLGQNLMRLRGHSPQLAMVDGKTLPDGRVIVPANGNNETRRIYARTAGSKWEPLECSVVKGRMTVHLDPDQLGASEVWLYISSAPVDLTDTTAPEFIGIRVNDRRFDAPGALGYLPEAERFSLTMQDRGKLLASSTEVVLKGDYAGTVPLSVDLRSLAPREPDKWRLTLRKRGGEMPPGRYTLTVRVSDHLANRSEYSFEFNTEGFATPFEALPIIASSGKVSKHLEGLDTMFYRSQEPGDFLTYEFKPPVSGNYRLVIRYTRYTGYGIFQTYLDDRPIGEPVDMYLAGLDPRGGMADLGVHKLTAGPHTLKLLLTGKNPDAPSMYLGICDLILRPIGGD
jgi:hypothetical protein